MNSVPKRRYRPGIGIVLLGLVTLAACGGEPSVVAPAAGPRTAASEIEGGALNDNAELKFERLPVESRLALMSGHAAAGLSLYRAGVPEDAAHHLMHLGAGARAEEVAGFDALGYKPEIFNQISVELEAGKSSVEIEPLLVEAETNLREMRAAAAGNPKDTIEFLMKSLAEEYDDGVDNSSIVNLGAYQDAYGHAIVARDMAATQDPVQYGSLKLELDLLVLMWPSKGPVSTSLPPPEFQVAEQLARVKLALAGLT